MIGLRGPRGEYLSGRSVLKTYHGVLRRRLKVPTPSVPDGHTLPSFASRPYAVGVPASNVPRIMLSNGLSFLGLPLVVD